MQNSQSDAAARNKRQILDHFEALINNKDLGAIDRNLGADFYDHDGPGGRPDAASEKPVIAALHELMPDVTVEVRAAVAEGDMVIVRNVWSGTNAKTGQRMECHGFVQWRVVDGKIVERWATVTSFKALDDEALVWGRATPLLGNSRSVS